MKIRTITTVFVALGLIAVTAPTGLAASQRSDSVTPLFATPTISASNFYEIDLAEDEQLDITVKWTDENTDLDLVVSEPGGTCEVLPSPAVGCLAASAQGNAASATCMAPPAQGQTVEFGPASETLSLTADQAGVHTVFVSVSTGVPNATVDYQVSADTGQDLGEPDFTNLIRSDGHCRGLVTPG